MSKLQPINLYISQLNYSCQVWRNRRKGVTGGLIGFDGFYPRGSVGSDDARFIRWRLDEFCTHPDLCLAGLVINLMGLDYERGDDLNVTPTARTLPWLVAIQESQKEAFSYVISKERLRFDLQAALAEMDEVMW